MFESWPELWGGGYSAYRTTLRKFLWFRTVTGGNAPEYDTVIGRIVSFITRRAAPLKIEASLSPIQDLHGYEAPWPPGGGKNLLNNTATTTTSNGVTFTVNADGTVSTQGTATGGTAVLRILQNFDQNADLMLSGCPSGGDYQNGYSIIVANESGAAVSDGIDIGNGKTIGTGYVSSIKQIQIIVRNGTNVSGKVFKPMLCLATAPNPTTYSPYSNECPISGHTGAEINRTGKNLIDSSKLYQTNANRVDIGTTANDYRTYLKAGTYTFQNKGTGVVYYQLKGSSSGESIHNQTTQQGTFAIDTDGLYAFWIYYWNGISAEDFTDVQLELGETATDYEPYSGTTVTITFGQTVYGGTLTVNEDGTGSVVCNTVGYVYVGDASENWKRSGTYNGSFYINTGTTHVWPSNVAAICSHAKPLDGFPAGYVYGGFGLDGSGKVNINVWVQDPNTTVEQFKTWLAAQNTNGTPLTFVLELATPITIPLTPGIVEALQGQNVVWVDSSDEIKVTYRSN